MKNRITQFVHVKVSNSEELCDAVNKKLIEMVESDPMCSPFAIFSLTTFTQCVIQYFPEIEIKNKQDGE